MEKIKTLKGNAKDCGYLPSLPQFSHLQKDSFDKKVVRDPAQMLKPVIIGSARYSSLQKERPTYVNNST